MVDKVLRKSKTQFQPIPPSHGRTVVKIGLFQSSLSALFNAQKKVVWCELNTIGKIDRNVGSTQPPGWLLLHRSPPPLELIRSVNN